MLARSSCSGNNTKKVSTREEPLAGPYNRLVILWAGQYHGEALYGLNLGVRLFPSVESSASPFPMVISKPLLQTRCPYGGSE